MKKMIGIVALALTIVVGANAQAIYPMYNALGSKLKVDSVVNTGTSTLTTDLSRPILKGLRATAQITITKISGTIAGSIVLQGSVDGIAWKTVQTYETQTALATLTATDVASQTFHYRLAHAFPYYRWSWTGTGTMLASFTGTVFVSEGVVVP